MALSLSALQRRKASGFTLIEVMIVVAIIGILSAVAYPSYTEYVRRGQISEAFTNLSSFRAKMEQYYQDNRNYGSSGTTCANDSSASAWNGFASTDYFSYTCTTSASGQAFSIVAKGTTGGAKDSWYAIDNEGHRTTTKYKGSDVSPAASCWLTKGTTCP